jgi:preprotein translocase subunit SecD
VTAIDQGYRGAMGTIWDSHITTIVSAIALYLVGTGPVKGFAVTLGIGLVISLFTAVVVVRLITATWLRHMRPPELPL